jgi:acyl-coenzyme A synthetase/AMP-(fatty) acid ligase
MLDDHQLRLTIFGRFPLEHVGEAQATLWQQDAHMVESYLSEFPGLYKTGNAGYRDAEGYVYVMARTEDIINVARDYRRRQPLCRPRRRFR